MLPNLSKMSYTILKRHICVQVVIIEIIVEHGNRGGDIMAIEIKEYEGFKPKKATKANKSTNKPTNKPKKK